MKLSVHYQRSPTIIKARMCLSELPGLNSDCKGEVEGFRSEGLRTFVLIFKCLCLGYSKLVSLGSVNNIS